MNPSDVLRLYDRQMRRELSSNDPDLLVERDGSTVLCFGPDEESWSALLWSDLDESTADAAIKAAIDRLRTLGRQAEWKLYAHDRPADLAQRLEAAGLVRGDEEAVVVADLEDLDLDVELPDDIAVRVAVDAEGVADFVTVQEEVFGDDYSALGRVLLRALAREPAPQLAVVCYAGDRPVSAARVEFNHRSEFASLWGGGTVTEWRRRGLYRASVAVRARIARDRGYRYLHVDAMPTSRPILERLGFVQLTTTTPYTVAA